MISKIIPVASIYHTCRYICSKSANVLLSEGVRDFDFKLTADDFEWQRQLKPGKGKAFLHAVLSFHPSDILSDEMLSKIAIQYLHLLGILNTQLFVVKHTDRSHTHLHILANMVDNDGIVIKDNFIGLRGKKAAQQLTYQHSLTVAIKKDLALTHLGNMNEYETSRYKIYIAIDGFLPLCSSIKELVTMLDVQGIETQFKYNEQSQEIHGISFKLGKFCFKGSKVDRKFSYNELKKTFLSKPD
jgi:hypothetical protein